MAKVSSTKCKKKDIFAPRKSVQDAKEKLGPAFFDPTLLECSRNAVELTKLVNEWENIDKEKEKFVRDLKREQNAITKSFKRNHSAHKCDREVVQSSEGIESTDGKQIPPGFRFRSNGEIKSVTSLARYQDDNADVNDRAGSSQSLSRVSSSNKDFSKDNSFYVSVDYQKEIEELEGVIENISTKLSTCKVSGSSTNGNKCYLRSHSHDVDNATFINPNSNHSYPLLATRSRKLHQSMIKTPCSRLCCGCQYKIKLKDDDAQITKKQDKDILNRRWCYVPVGKYVQSTSALRSASSVLKVRSSRVVHSRTDCKPRDSVGNNEQSASRLKSTTSVLRPCASRIANSRENDSIPDDSDTKNTQAKMSVHFQQDVVAPDRRHSAYDRSNVMKTAISSPAVDRQVKSAGDRAKSVPLNVAKSLPGLNTQQINSEECKDSATSQRAGSVISLNSRLSSEQISARLMVDYDSRMSLLKEYQVS